MKCEICGNKHATWEHRIYEKIKLVESGVPIENLFIMPDEETDNENVNKRLHNIREIVANEICDIEKENEGCSLQEK